MTINLKKLQLVQSRLTGLTGLLVRLLLLILDLGMNYQSISSLLAFLAYGGFYFVIMLWLLLNYSYSIYVSFDLL